MSTVAPDPAEAFCDSFGIRLRRPDLDLLHELSQAFARLPYENLTKLLKKYRFPPGPDRRRLPAEVIADHLRSGTGGTCFSLTTLFASVLQRLGYRCWPVLCDMRQARDNHCALIVDLAGVHHLLDPAYLLTQPVPLAGRPVTSIGPAARLVADEAGDGFHLYTYATWRYRVRPEPVPQERFLHLWDRSFDWTMMGSLHVVGRHGDGYAYVRNWRMRLRDLTARENRNIRGNEPQTLTTLFGIDAAVTEEAYRLLASDRLARRSPPSRSCR